MALTTRGARTTRAEIPRVYDVQVTLISVSGKGILKDLSIVTNNNYGSPHFAIYIDGVLINTPYYAYGLMGQPLRGHAPWTGSLTYNNPMIYYCVGTDRYSGSYNENVQSNSDTRYYQGTYELNMPFTKSFEIKGLSTSSDNTMYANANATYVVEV